MKKCCDTVSLPVPTVSFSSESVAAEPVPVPVPAAAVDSRKRAADGTPPVEPKPAKSSRRSIAVVPTVSCVTFVTVVNANLLTVAADGSVFSPVY